MQLLKYNIRGLMSLCVPAYLLAAIASGANIVLGMILSMAHENLPDLLIFVLVCIYQFTLLTVFLTGVATAIWVITDFYRSVLGKEGYLIHTLPMKTSQVLASKVVAGALVLWLSTLVVVGLYLIMSLFPNNYMLELAHFLDSWYDFSVFLQFIWAIMVTELLHMLCMFASLSLGHLTKHRIGLSVVFYLMLYHTVAAIPLFGTMYVAFGNGYDDAPEVFVVYCAFALAVSAGFYAIPHWVTNQKLNLE